MPVYWSMFFMTLVVGLLGELTTKKLVTVEGERRYTIQYVYAVFVFIYIIFFVGLRDKVQDTGVYVQSFINTPTNWTEMLQMVSNISSGKGFYFLQGIFKIFVSDNHYVWFVFLASISCCGLLRVLYKYSVDFPLTAYLFIANTMFTWLLNGTRQFLAVCILFAYTDWLLEGKKFRYILLVLGASLIHSSAIFMVPVCLFVSAKKLLGEKMVVFALITVIGTRYSEVVFNMLNFVLEKDYTEALAIGTGSNIIRLIVAAVPIMIVIMAYQYVKENASPSIYLAVNMSFIGVCFYFASSFTNGILVGRMPVYFTVYNLYLLPWLLKNCFKEKSKKIARMVCMVMYAVFFYYQMEIAWGGLMYVSDILNLQFF